MKRIPLTRGQFALVDDEDFEALSKFKWQALWNVTTFTFYARRTVQRNYHVRAILMHREILGVSGSDVVDHINHDTLDNRRANIRRATRAENTRNLQGAYRNSRSGIRGVQEREGRFIARIRVDGKLLNLGAFGSALLAAKAYAAANLKYFGEFGGQHGIA